MNPPSPASPSPTLAPAPVPEPSSENNNVHHNNDATTILRPWRLTPNLSSPPPTSMNNDHPDNNIIHEEQLAFHGDCSNHCGETATAAAATTTSDMPPVVIKIGDDAYLTFNRKQNVNMHTTEHPDRSLIIKEELLATDHKHFPDYSHSNLLKASSCPASSSAATSNEN